MGPSCCQTFNSMWFTHNCPRYQIPSIMVHLNGARFPAAARAPPHRPPSIPGREKDTEIRFVPRDVSVALKNSLQGAFTQEKGKKKKASRSPMLRGRQLTAYL